MKDRILTVRTMAVPEGSYEIIYTDSFAGLAGQIDKLPADYTRIGILTDRHVGPLYADAVRAELEPMGIPIHVLTIAAGEEHKNMDPLNTVLHEMGEKHFDRSSLLIALGGGVVGDLTGLAAAVWMRGIVYLQIPTTLLAQADSSIGGKTGVDLGGFKNMVGAFKMPVLVWENVSTLRTLDARQFSAGFAEVMKHGLILDENYYLWLIENLYEITDRDPPTLQEMLFRSNKIKRSIVEKDPFEQNERMLLNFGHTIGHALEKNSNFTLLHGECVALGCIAAARISYERGILSMEEYYEIRDMFVPFGLPITIDAVDPDVICELTRSDKKMKGDTCRFILLEGVGHAVIRTDVTPDEIKAAVREISYVEDGE